VRQNFPNAVSRVLEFFGNLTDGLARAVSLSDRGVIERREHFFDLRMDRMFFEYAYFRRSSETPDRVRGP
jgi:hypothetical protein